MRKHLENLNELDLAYIAGFLDGDGSIFAQIVPGAAYKYDFTVRVSVAFFQKNEKK